jgi:hypothetical protein
MGTKKPIETKQHGIVDVATVRSKRDRTCAVWWSAENVYWLWGRVQLLACVGVFGLRMCVCDLHTMVVVVKGWEGVPTGGDGLSCR